MGKIKLTERQIDIVARLNDDIYTIDYLEEWLNRNDNVYINAPAALSAMGASGFYCAVAAMERLEIMQEQAAESGASAQENPQAAEIGEPPAEENQHPAKPLKPPKHPRKRNNKKLEVKENENDDL